jgi:trans-2,3-dihydro-3-hydroxyanthranilate isomerase
MVPFKSLSAIRRASVIPDGYAQMVELTSVRALYLFVPETYNPDNDFNARMFAPHFGITEDPATGAGAGCLAAYLLEYTRPGMESVDVRVEQGYEMRRPSILFARARRSNGGMRVAVGGRIAMVAQGHFI